MDGSSGHVIGRDPELAFIDAFIATAAGGTVALVIEGVAGIGKTTLWETALRIARDRGCEVLATRATQAETALSFAGLIDLLSRVPDETLARLPAPQRQALEVALLRREAEQAVDSGAISVAFINVIRAVARQRTVLIAVDDLAWLDGPSARVLEFAQRRLRDEPVGILATDRTGGGIADRTERALGPDRTRRLTVGPVSMNTLYQLVRTRLGSALARPVLSRIHETSGGNPLFGLELARATLERADDVRPGRPLPAPEHVSDLLRRRVERLPTQTRRVLLAVAATPSLPVAVLARVADLDSERDARREVDRAERAGVIEIRAGTVTFAHPLLASVVYDGASPADQRLVHSRLAEVAADPEERARHVALSGGGPDDATAKVVDLGASRALVRGATDVAAQLAAEALRLTPAGSAADIYRRALAAGSLAASAGDHDRGRELIGEALTAAGPGAERAEALVRLAELATPLRLVSKLCGQALADAGDDASLRSRIHRTWGAIAYFVGDVSEAEDHARRAVEFARKSRDRTALAMATAELGHWTFCGGGGIRRDLFERAVALDSSPGAAGPRSHFANILLDSGDFAAARPMLEVLLSESMRLGDLQGAAVHRFHLAELEAWAGNWLLAIEHADESLLLRRHSDRPSAPLAVKAMCHAWMGRLDESVREANAGLIEAERVDDTVSIMQNLHVLGFAALSIDDVATAHRHLGRATDLLRPRWNREFGDCHFVPDEIESVIALGDLDRAEDLVEWMEAVGTRTARDWTLATGARARALLMAARGELAAAEAATRAALDAHERLAMPFERARTLLVRGTIERRGRRRAAAARTLAEAVGEFERLESPLWAARARKEAARIGVRTAAQRSLTPVETRIAGLVADGLTNREIAGLLFVSPKTVEASLTHVYRKLEIRSRGELAAWSSRRTAEEGTEEHAEV